VNNILERVAAHGRHFTPSKPSEYLALQVARKLGEQIAFRHYLVLFEHYAEKLLLDIYRRCANEGNLTSDRFLEILQEVTQ
jgi:hypothetical protein